MGDQHNVSIYCNNLGLLLLQIVIYRLFIIGKVLAKKNKSIFLGQNYAQQKEYKVFYSKAIVESYKLSFEVQK